MPSFKKLLVGALAVSSGNAVPFCGFIPEQVFAWGIATQSLSTTVPHYALSVDLTPVDNAIVPTTPTSYYFDEEFANDLTQFTFNGQTQPVFRIWMESDLKQVNFTSIPKQIICNGTYEMTMTTYCGYRRGNLFCENTPLENAQFLLMAQMLFDEVKRRQTCPVEVKPTAEVTTPGCQGLSLTFIIFGGSFLLGSIISGAIEFSKKGKHCFFKSNETSAAQIENGNANTVTPGVDTPLLAINSPAK